ncbi:hypothetical protein ANN_20517 [Periplaneta americana]|uniref:UDP-glucuronosyltransferase n=1 Tax=Periplaneta americana TaxID=6978 RepID=A0ABQ8SDL6_PERAM|nr:hypothetical protein ANN_20517 [Periplaneta americana]
MVIFHFVSIFQVTEISILPSSRNTPNLTILHLEGTLEIVQGIFSYKSINKLDVTKTHSAVSKFVKLQCEHELTSASGQKLLHYSSTQQFDVIITEACMGECLYGFIHKFGSPPVIAISSLATVPWMASALGAASNPSYMPYSLLEYSSRMNFKERLINFLVFTFASFSYNFNVISVQESIARKHFKEDLPSFNEIQKNISLYLTNTIQGLDFPRPLTPNVVPVGGMHLTSKTNPLPASLQKFLDEAKDGVILFCLGTWIRSDLLKEKVQVFLDAFSELSQRVLWKLDTERLPGQPPNVLVSKWLPQSDILAHPNVRLFITHCGRMSMIETVYRGVPVVGVPLFADQFSVLTILQSRGAAVGLDYPTLTKESILVAVREVLNNESYKINMKQLSKLVKDQPDDPLDRAVFWTEYVIRHKGAEHLRPASTDLYWHQYLLLDVLMVLTVGLLMVVMLTYLTVKRIYRILKSLAKAKTD